MNIRKQSGATTVEFAIIGVLAMTTLLAVLEVGRAFFVYNALEEVTRRGARMAAVCQVNANAINRVAVFNDSGSSAASPVVAGLTPGNVVITYLNQTGAPLTDPAGSFGQIRYVNVSIQNFTHSFLVPGLSAVFDTPRFSTTLPRESLGVTRGEGLQSC